MDVSKLRAASNDKLKLLNMYEKELGNIRIIRIPRNIETETDKFTYYIDGLDRSSERNRLIEQTGYEVCVDRPYGLTQLIKKDVYIEWEWVGDIEEYEGVILDADGNIVTENISKGNLASLDGLSEKERSDKFSDNMSKCKEDVLDYVEAYSKYNKSEYKIDEHCDYDVSAWPGVISRNYGKYQIASFGMGGDRRAYFSVFNRQTEKVEAKARNLISGFIDIDELPGYGSILIWVGVCEDGVVLVNIPGNELVIKRMDIDKNRIASGERLVTNILSAELRAMIVPVIKEELGK